LVQAKGKVVYQQDANKELNHQCLMLRMRNMNQLIMNWSQHLPGGEEPLSNREELGVDKEDVQRRENQSISTSFISMQIPV
jgi:hypothetical protein